MNRHIEIKIKEWKARSPRKPLMVKGARQVGKSFTIEKFGRENFESCVVANFEKQRGLIELFEGDLDPSLLLEKIELLLKTRIAPGKTLLFLDEIQKCPRAITSLRYFYEKKPDLAVIAAGSLLDFALGETSVPVGRIHYLYMHPLSFFEFLEALGETLLQDYLLNRPLPREEDPIHAKCLGLVKKYMQIGGMPEAVKIYLETGSVREVTLHHQNLIETYRQDFSKYAPRIPYAHLLSVLEKIPQLIGQQIKYAHIDREIRSTYLKEVISLLERAQILSRVRAVRNPQIPLSSHASDEVFKTIFLDVGLMQNLCGVDWSQISEKSDLTVLYQGMLAEQFVGQEILSYTSTESSKPLFYWKREERGAAAEVDYLIEHQGALAPLEVKSDKKGRLKSLHWYRSVFHPKKAFVVSSHPAATEDNICWIPFYALSTLFPNIAL
ncbi:MAG: ATP-binding protein [Chlamydiae bacterium]|nr:ATP-binding protein [Chlamydiota bacterium]MBI3267224.1 ATP-binding protein [Chlamydiota bacterium]